MKIAIILAASLFAGQTVSTDNSLPDVATPAGIMIPLVAMDDSDDPITEVPKKCTDLTNVEIPNAFSTGPVGVMAWERDCLVLGTCTPGSLRCDMNTGATSGQACKCG